MRITTQMKRDAERMAKRMSALTDSKFEFEPKIVGNTDIEFYGPNYFDMQDKGVQGIKSGSSKAGYKYKKPYDVPASAFSDYTSDVSHQFAIARSVENKGIKAKEYVKEFKTDTQLLDIITDFGEEMITSTIDNINN